jgi:hypothetical protein
MHAVDKCMEEKKGKIGGYDSYHVNGILNSA